MFAMRVEHTTRWRASAQRMTRTSLATLLDLMVIWPEMSFSPHRRTCCCFCGIAWNGKVCEFHCDMCSLTTHCLQNSFVHTGSRVT